MITHQVSNTFGFFNYNAHIFSNTSWNSHFHGNYELIYSLDGKTEIMLNGCKTTITAGELILISPYTVHSLDIPADSISWIGVFSPDYVPFFYDNTRFVRYSKFICNKDNDAFLLKNLFFAGQPEHYMLTACLNLVCNECTCNATVSNVSEDYKFIHNIIEYISENIYSDISMKDVADNLNYEYHYFSSLFHRNFAMNFKSFINRFRFENACRLLVSTGNSMPDICNKCGFGSIRNFNRVFKDLCGMTPKEYRLKFLN